jgi:hypothetical protein
MLGDTPGGIVSMNEISALSIAVYKTDAIYQAVAQTEFQGVAAPFRFELSKAGISGPCSPAAVVRNHDGRQVYLARDGGVYMYDGVAPIDGGRNIRRMIQDHIDYNNLDKVWGMVDRQRKLIWYFYPTVGGTVNRGIVISTDQGFPWKVWSLKLPDGWNFVTGSDVVLTQGMAVSELNALGSYTTETLGSFSSGEQTMLMGTLNNIWYRQKWADDGAYTDDGIPIPIRLHGGWVAPGNDLTLWTADEMTHLFQDKLQEPVTIVSMYTPEEPVPEEPPLPPDNDPIVGEGVEDPAPPPGDSTQEATPELQVRLLAQQIGNVFRATKWVPLYAGTKRRRTRHRTTGIRFRMEMEGSITRMFNWAGAMLSVAKRGKR